MNLLNCIGVYAAMCKEMELPFRWGGGMVCGLGFWGISFGQGGQEGWGTGAVGY